MEPPVTEDRGGENPGGDAAFGDVSFSAEEIKAILAKDLAAIRAKAEAGKPLTEAEVRRLRQSELSFEDQQQAALAPIWADNQVELAKELGCDRKTIQRYLKMDGNPGKASDGRYNVTQWKLWAEEKGRLKKGRKSGDKEDEELRGLKLKNERIEIENAIRRGELLHVDEVCRTLCEMMAAFVDGSRGMKHRIAPHVVGVSVGEAAKRIGHEVDETLTRLSLGEWAKKKTFWSSVSATLQDQLKKYGLGHGASAT